MDRMPSSAFRHLGVSSIAENFFFSISHNPFLAITESNLLKFSRQFVGRDCPKTVSLVGKIKNVRLKWQSISRITARFIQRHCGNKIPIKIIIFPFNILNPFALLLLVAPVIR
jgi:hypothetical protein